MIYDEGEGHRCAGAANRGRGKDDIAAELARDAVAGVREGEVAEAVNGDAPGSIEWSVEGGGAVLSGAVRTRGAVWQACGDSQAG